VHGNAPVDDVEHLAISTPLLRIPSL
jgi:hypothetical protein